MGPLDSQSRPLNYRSEAPGAPRARATRKGAPSYKNGVPAWKGSFVSEAGPFFPKWGPGAPRLLQLKKGPNRVKTGAPAWKSPLIPESGPFIPEEERFFHFFLSEFGSITKIVAYIRGVSSFGDTLAWVPSRGQGAHFCAVTPNHISKSTPLDAPVSVYHSELTSREKCRNAGRTYIQLVPA